MERETLEQELKVLVVKTRPKLLFKWQRKLGSHMANDAEDVLQQAYTKAFSRLDSFRMESGLKTWLYRVVSNEFLDYLRKQRRRGKYFVHTIVEAVDSETGLSLESVDFATKPNQYEVALIEEIRVHLHKVVDNRRGTSLHSEVVDLLVSGASANDIAGALGVNVQTVKSIIFRLRCTLYPVFTNYRRVRADFATRTEKKLIVLKKGAGA